MNLNTPDLEQKIWKLLDEIKDPEIPVISIVELGIIRGFEITNNSIEVVVTPTFSGCPAKEVINNLIARELQKHFQRVVITNSLNPPWTTNDIDPKAFNKLSEYGIAPPLIGDNHILECPRCNSVKVEELSFFGATACKAQYRCLSCFEPFEYFKPLRKVNNSMNREGHTVSINSMKNSNYGKI